MPHKRRCFSARKCSRSAPAYVRSPKRHQKRKTWLEESMQAALKAVEDGQTVSQAARDRGIPKTTLIDRISGR